MNALHTLLAAAACAAGAALAAPITVVDSAGKPLPTVMVSRQQGMQSVHFVSLNPNSAPTRRFMVRA